LSSTLQIEDGISLRRTEPIKSKREFRISLAWLLVVRCARMAGFAALVCVCACGGEMKHRHERGEGGACGLRMRR